MKKEDILAIQNLLASPKNVAIIPHRSPDGDAMGSTLALYHFLKKLNHKPVVISPNEIPNYLNWLPSSDTVLVYEKDKELCGEKILQADLVFTLDFNALHRTGEMEQVLSQVSNPIIMVDHHQKPDSYATITYSDTSFGSTCEMIFNLIAFLDQKEQLDKTIATCIYCGITTDSGSFRYPSTTSKTHKIVAELLDLGIDNSEIHNLLFDNNSAERLQLIGRSLQNIKVFPQYKTSYITISQQELDTFGYEKGDTEGIVNYGLTIKGINFTAIFIEHSDENIIKISFRSQGSFDVNAFAREHFCGGGHINAAGGKSYDTLKATTDKFEKLISKITI